MRAAGYARVSTDEQAREGLSLSDQEYRIREYAAAQGWELVDVFTDRGVSGSIPFATRPAGAEAFAAEVDCLVVVSWDRLARGAADFLAVVRDREVVSVTEHAEPPLLRDLRAVLNEEERRKTGQRTKAAAGEMFRAGRYNGPAPIGYRFEAGHLVAVAAEVAIVERIFREFVAGATITAIVRGLNADEIPTRRGGNWRVSSIRTVLTNPVYVGRVRMGEDEREGQHDAVLDPDLFDQAQELFAARAIATGKGRGRPPAGRHLFRKGALRCGLCGEAVVPRTPTRGRDHYLCAGRQITGCKLPIAYREDIDAAVYAYFEQVGLDVEATREGLAESRDRKLAEVRALLDGAEAEAQRAGERLARVRRDYADGKLDASDWQEFRTELGGELEGAQAEVERLRAQALDVEAWSDLRDAESDALEHLTEIRRAIVGEVREAEGVEAVRAALLRMFERFVLHPSGAGPERVHAELALVPGFVIEPVIREQAIAGYSEHSVPVLRREPLDQAVNNERQGVAQRSLLAPIPVVPT